MWYQVNQDAEFSHELTPLGRVLKLRREGFTFVDRIADRTEEVFGLWGKTFGWSFQGVEERRDVVENQRFERAGNRRSWFAGIVHPDGRLVAAAVAERLDLPTGLGTTLPIIELSEWKSADGEEGRGLMATNNSYLIAQVLSDLADLQPAPLLFAETNYRSFAHRVGFASGMTVERKVTSDLLIPQILVQNVAVGDGYLPEGLRDFTVMYVDKDSARTYYSARSRVAMLGEDRVYQGREI